MSDLISDEMIEWWHNTLDRYRQTMENAQEEYGQQLGAFEDACGESLREAYEEKYA